MQTNLEHQKEADMGFLGKAEKLTEFKCISKLNWGFNVLRRHIQYQEKYKVYPLVKDLRNSLGKTRLSFLGTQ